MAMLVDKGHEVFIKVMSLAEKLTGDDRRENEALNAIRSLRIKYITFDGNDEWHREFGKYRQKILDDFYDLSLNYNPDIVILPQTGDIHQDHKVVHEEGIRAFRNSTILGYDMPASNLNFDGRYFIPLNKVYIDMKYSALQCYLSVKDKPYMHKDYIYGLAKVRGTQCGSDYAEAFEAIRVIGGVSYALGTNGGQK